MSEQEKLLWRNAVDGLFAMQKSILNFAEDRLCSKPVGDELKRLMHLQMAANAMDSVIAFMALAAD